MVFPNKVIKISLIQELITVYKVEEVSKANKSSGRNSREN